jgi:predicted transcriptional regulator
MSTTITFRVDDELRRELEERASGLGKTLSEVVREILEAAVAREPIGERAAHLRGRLRLPRSNSEPWRRELRERNWRP